MEQYPNRPDEKLLEKYAALKEFLRRAGSVAVAFSGGVDSAFLLFAAKEALGGRVIAVTARSCFFPVRELGEAEAFCRDYGVRHLVFDAEELEIEGLSANPSNRCYLCKRDFLEKIRRIAAEQGMAEVAEGSNLDDLGDYRPGLRAVEELGVKSPLRQAGFHKEEIRTLSRYLGLPTWDKQSFACLATRFEYGETLTREKLAMVEKAEQLLMDLGFHQLRVRVHGRVARIEILPGEFEKLLKEERRIAVCSAFRSLGFSYVTMDLLGYRTGSMNETLPGKTDP